MHNNSQTINLRKQNQVETQKKVEKVERFFKQYGGDIRKIINFHVEDKSIVDDIYQDFFLSMVYEDIPEDNKNIKAFLYRALTNDIIDNARYKKSYQNRIKRFAKSRRNYLIENDPQDVIIKFEEAEEMFRVIEKQLSEREKEVLIYRYKYEHDTGEVAKKMNIKKRSVSRYLASAMKKVRQSLYSDKDK